MSDKNYDLPGFYRDPKTGKYFRDNPTAMKNRSLEKLKKVNENQNKILKESTNYPKYSNILKFLFHRETGNFSGVHSEQDFCRMVTYNKKEISHYDLNLPNNGFIDNVEYVRGTPSFVLTVWAMDQTSKPGCSIITHQPLNRDRGFLCKKVDSHSVTDLCEGPDMTVVYIYNNPTTDSGGIKHLRLQPEELVSNSCLFLTITREPLYCCASTTDQRQIAIGSHKVVLYYHPGHLTRKFHVLKEGRVHTISFNHASNLMVMGIHTGHISLKDMRKKKLITNLKISDYCINESYFLEPNQVIVGGLENVLCKVDLRMNRTVTEYFEHKTSTRKSALSVANNMLCAAGADNVVRIWHLSGGRPVHEMNHLYSPENKVKAWLFDAANKTYLYHFEAGRRKTFLLA